MQLHCGRNASSKVFLTSLIKTVVREALFYIIVVPGSLIIMFNRPPQSGLNI